MTWIVGEIAVQRVEIPGKGQHDLSVRVVEVKEGRARVVPVLSPEKKASSSAFIRSFGGDPDKVHYWYNADGSLLSSSMFVSRLLKAIPLNN